MNHEEKVAKIIQKANRVLEAAMNTTYKNRLSYFVAKQRACKPTVLF